MTEAIKSKYTLTDIPGGFLVQREGGFEIGITYGDTWLHVGTENVGLYQFPEMVDKLAEQFMDQLVKGYLNKRKRKEGVYMIARALSKRIKPHWQRIVHEIVPPDVAELARLMWSSVHGDARILHIPELYTDAYKHLRSDLRKYHACRLIAKREEDKSHRYDDYASTSLIERTVLWRQLYAGNAVSSKAFNKTLDAMPRALSFKTITALMNIHLDQPITNRLHLIAVLSGADHYHWYMHERILLGASETAIRTAAAEYGLNDLTSRSKTERIRNFISLVLDYPAPFNGDFVALSRRSQEWHHQNFTLPADQGLTADTRLPQLDLDYAYLSEEGVVPLETVGAVAQEGELMHHCVGSYARRAYDGHSFLFHVEHNGEWATIELNASGGLEQAYGPRNTINSACKWGAECLGRAAAKTILKVIPAVPF